MVNQPIQFDPAQFDQDKKLLSQQQLPIGWRWIASSKTTKVAYNESHSIYFKEFLPRSRLERIKSIIKGSRCSRAISIATIMHESGLNTPKVLSSGNLDNGHEYLVTEGIFGVGITSYLASYLRRTNDSAVINWKRKVITALGEEIGKLHAKKIIHGDLRPNNVLIKLGESRPTFYFIDNDRSFRWYFQPPEHRLVKNLVQIGMLFPIDISKTDRLRFWRAYCNQNPRYSNNQQQTRVANKIYQLTVNRLTNSPHYKPKQPDLPPQYLTDGLVVPAKSDTL